MKKPILLKCKHCQWKGELENLLPDVWDVLDYCPQCGASFAGMYEKELNKMEGVSNEKKG